jgi:hypothetical protein
MDAVALREFAQTYSTAPIANAAKLYISLHEKARLYQEKKATPDVVIPFSQLGLRWAAWSKKPIRGMLGYSAEKTAAGTILSVLPMETDEIVLEEGLGWQVWAATDLETTEQRMAGLRKLNLYNLALGRQSAATELAAPLTARAPTADGSIIAFQAKGVPLVWLGLIQFASDGDETLYFVVSRDCGGLAHLAGKGKCVVWDRRKDGTIVHRELQLK